MRLNWFSPLPPAKTGIANHTADMLPVAASRAEVILWTDQSEWDASLEAHAKVRRYRPDQVPWADLHRGDITLYDIGNNPDFHSSIWDVAQQHPGIVILHDLCLQPFFCELFLVRRRDRNGYIERMARHYGAEGAEAAKNFETVGIERLSSTFPLTPLAIENALGAIVHTQEALEVVERAGCPAAYCPLPYAGLSRCGAENGVKRQDGSSSRPPYRLIVFGHIGFNRRLDGLFQALAQIEQPGTFHLDVFGELQDANYFRKRVRELDLSKSVTLHGFVQDGVLENALRTAHLAVNLRFPTMGEASASQLRIWNHSLPTLVTPVGWYATLPKDAVAFVRPDHEVVDILSHLQALLCHPERFATMGRKGRRYLEEHHTPMPYIDGILGLARRAMEMHGRKQASYLIQRIGAEMSSWINPDEPEELYLGPAEQIRLLTR